MSETKKCSKCLEIKSLNEFNKNKSKKFGVASVCKICHSNYRKEHYIKNKTKVIEQVNEYRVKNPDKVTKYTMNAFSKKLVEQYQLIVQNVIISYIKIVLIILTIKKVIVL